MAFAGRASGFETALWLVIADVNDPGPGSQVFPQPLSSMPGHQLAHFAVRIVDVTELPATGGALYGPASHGWQASFQRPGVKTKLQGLYLAGGSVHPGPGIPMATLSGRMAAAALLADLGQRR